MRKLRRWIGPVFLLFSSFVLLASVYWQVDQRKKNPLREMGVKIKLASAAASQEPFQGDPGSIEAEIKLVNVFASWCTPCIAELPYLAQLREATGLPMVGIAWNDHESRLRPWLKAHGNPFDLIYLDPKGYYWQILSLREFPKPCWWMN